MMRRKRALEVLEQQIRDHIEQETHDNIERGLSPDEARHAAVRKFGNVALVKEDVRAVWTPIWLDGEKLLAHAYTSARIRSGTHSDDEGRPFWTTVPQ